MFKLHLYIVIIAGLLFYSLSAVADDSMIEKQRKFQKQMFERFTELDRRFNGDDSTKTKVNPDAIRAVNPPASFVDHLAFPNNERDPFAVPYQLLQSLANERTKKGIANTSTIYTKAPSTALPKVKLKGILHHQNNASPLAIMLLNNETYMVRNGDEIGFNPADPSQVIKIKEIKRLSVLIEVGTLGELVIVR